jgi:hypothetical protein
MSPDNITERQLVASRANDVAKLLKQSGMSNDKVTVLALGLLFIVSMKAQGINELDLSVLLADFWRHGGETEENLEKLN